MVVSQLQRGRFRPNRDWKTGPVPDAPQLQADAPGRHRRMRSRANLEPQRRVKGGRTGRHDGGIDSILSVNAIDDLAFLVGISVS
jgi:hypothetical protein